MNTYAVLLVDRLENGKVEAYRWMSEPYLTADEAEREAENLRSEYGESIEVHPTFEGFNVWNADII